MLTATVPTPTGACVGLVPWRRARAWTWWGQGGAERQVIEVGQRQARGDRRAGGPVPGLTPPGRLPRVHGSYEQLWAGRALQLEETPETPPSSRAEGLLFLHGLESNPGSSLQTEEEAGLP